MDHFCRCFCLRCCLRCWHSNTNYTRNITPTYKTHYYPTWGGILADVCSALLFPFTHLPLHTPRRHHWPTLLHRLSLSNTGGLFSPFSLPVSTSHCPWRLLYIHFPMQRVQWKRLVSHRGASQSMPPGNHWLALNFAVITPSVHYRPGSDPQLVILLVLHWLRRCNNT